jgi:tRNA threonylcarbamoyl adenosine modification protein YjeE
MSDTWTILRLESASEHDLCLVAEAIALKLAPGDVIALDGELGAGKTTFARAFIRALAGDPAFEVPSPTFAIAQAYDDVRVPLTHFDWYRLGAPDELDEIGLPWEARAPEGAALVEWPERAADRLPDPHFLLRILDVADAPDRRTVELSLIGSRETDTSRSLTARIDRTASLLHFARAFERRTGARISRMTHVTGDASARSYARLYLDGGSTAVLMDSPAMADGPPLASGKPYSRVAHLAETITPFLAIADALRQRAVAAPEVLHADAATGFAALEDFGDAVFDRIKPDDLETRRRRTRAALDVLLHLRAQGPAPHTIQTAEPALTHTLAVFDADALHAELDLLLQWAWDAETNAPLTTDVVHDFQAAWDDALNRVLGATDGWVLRDYHSPNLIWRADQQGIARVGVIDFQDAMRGHWAYDVASLIQDARVDIPPPLRAELLDQYCAEAAKRFSDFDIDAFRAAFALFGAQRATKIIGIFHRLAARDGKPRYLAHLPRVTGYLAENLRHPALAPVRAWFERHLPTLIDGEAAAAGSTLHTAMVLAAGRGTRMRHLGAERPKPLVAVGDRPLIDHVLDRIAAAGISRAVVNVHTKADMIEAHLAERTAPAITISDERDSLLETGGGVARALPLIADDSFLIHNSDCIWREGAISNLQRLMAAWRPDDMDTLLLLADTATAVGYDGAGDFFLGDDGRLTRRTPGAPAPLVFTGASVAHRRLFDGAPAGAFSLNRLWDQAAARGRLFGSRLDGLWMHVGTPEAVAEVDAILRAESDAD